MLAVLFDTFQFFNLKNILQDLESIIYIEVLCIGSRASCGARETPVGIAHGWLFDNFFSSVRPLRITEKVSHLDFKIGLHLENLVSMKFTRSLRPRKLCARHQPRACKCKSVTSLVYSTIRDALMNLWSLYIPLDWTNGIPVFPFPNPTQMKADFHRPAI